MRLKLLHIDQDAVDRSEADDDLGDAEEERLDPVFHELLVEFDHGVVAADLARGLELDPVDWASLFEGLRVPDYVTSEHERGVF